MIGTQIAAAFENRTALVTGGTGLIGREVVRRLCDFGARVRSVSLDELPTDSRAEQVSGDLRSFDFCREITVNMDFVFHVAGIKGSVDVTKAQPASTFVPLMLMNTSVLEAARENGAAKVVYTNADYVVLEGLYYLPALELALLHSYQIQGEPASNYVASKIETVQ